MIIKDITGSTNDDIRALAAGGSPEWTTVIAKEQTGGKGQVGRTFYAPRGGLYMSVLLRPKLRPEQMCLITTAACVATARGIEEKLQIETQVKWVNDLYYKGRKVCGILTEAVLDEEGRAEYAVLGIGINLTRPEGGFPAEIRETAGYLTEETQVTAEELGEEILAQFKKIYEELPQVTYREEYVRRMGPGGTKVYVTEPCGSSFEAQIEGVDEDFRLILERDGKTFTIGEKNRIHY